MSGSDRVQSPVAIGVDIGGTKIAAGLVDLNSGAVWERRRLPAHPERGGTAVLGDVIDVCHELTIIAAASGVTVRAIGIGVPELVDRSRAVQSAHLFDWREIDVTARLRSLAPAVVEADVRAAALAEARFGAGRPFSTFVYISAGTGISSCLVIDGQPFAGSRGNALVLASAPLTIRDDDRERVVEQILEEYASGPALAARYRRRTGRAIDGAETVLAAANAGQTDAVAVVASASEALGNAVGFLVNVLDPGAVVIGGGLGLAGGLFHERFVQSTRDHIWSPVTRELPILPAWLGPDAGLVGAALAAWNEIGQSSAVGCGNLPE